MIVTENTVSVPSAPLARICSRISSGGTPSRKHPDYFSREAGHLWVKSKELLDRSIWTTEERITDDGLARSSARYFPEDTVLVAMYGANVGQMGYLRRRATVNQAICGLVVDRSIADPEYVFYALMHCRPALVAKAFGAAQQNLNQDAIRNFSIPVPSLPTQRKIASILSAYDDLIENNTRRIAILEEMAQSLYREWFVHYRYPGHEHVPLVDSPIGPVPEGWEVKQLGDVIELAYGKALKASDRREGLYPVYGSSGIVGHHDTYLVKGPGIIVGRKGNVGSVYYSEDDFYPIDTVFFVRTELPLEFVFYALQEITFVNSDVAVPGLNRAQGYLVPLVVPDSECLRGFVRSVTPLLSLARDLDRVNDNLRQTRDLLLPRLISGDLDITQFATE